MWYLVVSIALGSAPAGAHADRDHRPTLRPYKQINDEIRQAFRDEAAAKDMSQRAAAVHRMAALYRELLRDPRLQTSETLKGYKARLWSRLTRIKAELERQIKRRRRLARRGNAGKELAAIEHATRSLAGQISLMNYSMGGPAYVLEHGAGSAGSFGGRTRSDYGQDLVDLIQRTIKPDFWDVHGGPGTVYYYRPLMALVVRATSEVHGNVAGLLGAMREAGP